VLVHIDPRAESTAAQRYFLMKDYYWFRSIDVIRCRSINLWKRQV
jgi:hypothetical protein